MLNNLIRSQIVALMVYDFLNNSQTAQNVFDTSSVDQAGGSRWQQYHRQWFCEHFCHYNDVIMSAMASQITSLTTVYSIVYSSTDERKTSKLRVIGLCVGNSPVTGEFPTQMASNVENVSNWWRHHVWLMQLLKYHSTCVIDENEHRVRQLWSWIIRDCVYKMMFQFPLAYMSLHKDGCFPCGPYRSTTTILNQGLQKE